MLHVFFSRIVLFSGGTSTEMARGMEIHCMQAVQSWLVINGVMNKIVYIKSFYIIFICPLKHNYVPMCYIYIFTYLHT